MACYWLNQNETKVAIPGVEDIGGIVYYRINVTIKEYRWTVARRYSEFHELHGRLVSDHGVSKDQLPPKKVLGSRAPEFVHNRRLALESYLQSVLKYLRITMPRIFIEFLDLHIYDIFFLLQNMSFHFYTEADAILSSEKAYVLHPLQMHAISQCCKVPFPNTDEADKRYDLSHTFDLCSQLKQLIIYGKSTKHILSNIVPNDLPFEFSSFKSLVNMHIQGLSMDNVYAVGGLRNHLEEFMVTQSSMTSIAQILQCDILHKSSVADQQKWTSIRKLDLSNNKLQAIDDAVKLVPNVETLIFNNNEISEVASLTSLSKLTHLHLSNNIIASCDDLHVKLGNIITLDMSRNRIATLRGFARLFSLHSLDVSCNQLVDVDDVRFIGELPCISNLVLTGNAVATTIDYRIMVLEHFAGTRRSADICLDNENPSQAELDKVALQRALRIVKEGRTPDIRNSNFSEF